MSDSIQLMDACACFAYAFVVTMATLIFLEPFMFLGRGRRRRSDIGAPGERVLVEDRDVIRDYPQEDMKLPHLAVHKSM